MKKVIAFCVLIILTTGCVSVKHIPLTKVTSAGLTGKSVNTTHYPKADFTAFTAGKAAFGVLGAAAMISAGNKLVKNNEIPDPAIAITSGLKNRLIKFRQINTVESEQKFARNDKIKELISTYSGADYLLDVKTLSWMFSYYPTDWSHYRVTYSARFRLIDTSMQKIIAETKCTSVQGDDKQPPTKEQLLTDKAALLKNYLNKASIACIEELSKDILMI